MVQARWWLLLFALAIAATPVRAQDINWQEAVARLARERTQAETCLGVLKQHIKPDDAAAIDRLSLTYGDAKAEYDAVISGLIVALAQKEQPASLPDLQARLARGFVKREAFCKSAKDLVVKTGGEKGVIADIVEGALEPLIKAAVEIYKDARGEDLLTRKTIQTQLEATKWPAFASVLPPS